MHEFMYHLWYIPWNALHKLEYIAWRRAQSWDVRVAAATRIRVLYSSSYCFERMQRRATDKFKRRLVNHRPLIQCEMGSEVNAKGDGKIVLPMSRAPDPLRAAKARKTACARYCV